MAKNKGSKNTAAEAADADTSNGAVLMEVMPDDFDIPSARQGISSFDAKVKQVAGSEKNAAGKFPVFKVFEQVVSADEEAGQKDLMKAYTKAKQVKAAAKKLKLDGDITVAVRRIGEQNGLAVHAVLAQRNATAE